MQEGKAGMDTVLAVYTEAKVIMRRVDQYPVTLTVFKVEGTLAFLSCSLYQEHPADGFLSRSLCLARAPAADLTMPSASND
jgi:hypothetical protein